MRSPPHKELLLSGGGDEKKWEPSFTAGENVKGADALENGMTVPQKAKHEVPNDLMIPL